MATKRTSKNDKAAAARVLAYAVEFKFRTSTRARITVSFGTTFSGRTVVRSCDHPQRVQRRVRRGRRRTQRNRCGRTSGALTPHTGAPTRAPFLLPAQYRNGIRRTSAPYPYERIAIADLKRKSHCARAKHKSSKIANAELR